MGAVKRLPLPLVLLAALGVALAGWVRACGQADRAERAAVSAGEVAELRAAGVAAAAELDRRALAGRLEAAQRWAVGLEEQVRRVREAMPGARPVAVVTGTTGPVQAGGGSPAPALEPGGGLPVSDEPPPPGRACLLWDGERGEIRGAATALRSEAGTLAVVAAAEAWRLDPALRLFGGELHLEVATDKPPQTGRGPSWGIGVAGVVTRDGWSAGPALAAPPLRLWRWQLEPNAAFTLGGSGQWAGAATVIVRRSR